MAADEASSDETTTSTGAGPTTGGGPSSDSTGARIAPETIFEVLSNQRRRHVLHYLKARGERATVREVSEQVAAWENEIARNEVTPKERKRVYTALHQTHLPKMAEVGVIDYDRDRGTLELTDVVAAFDIYLEVVPESELSWSEFYLGLGAVATALVAVAAMGIYPFSLLSGFGYALLLSVGLLVVAAVHTYGRRRDRIGSGDPAVVAPRLPPPE
jgi:hypothetical protein